LTGSVVPAADTNEGAGLVSRTVAAAVDIAVVLLAVLVGYLAVAGARLVFRPRTFAWPEPGSTALTTIGVVAMVAYLAALWSTTGRTGGDQLMGIRVVNDRGERIGMARALARSALCVVFPVGLLWCAVDRRRRSVQDLLIHTTVIYDWHTRIPPRAGAARADA
jgi:uncharacterized RDD family membrane protein YckC